MSKLEELLKEKYNISEAESKESTQCLIDLFKIFHQIDSRQKQENLIQEQSNIKVKEVQIEFIKPNNGMIGFASLIIENSIYLSSIAIHKKLNAEGYRITYPSKGKFSIFYPINKEVSRQIEEAIFKKLEEVINKSKELCSDIIIIH